MGKIHTRIKRKKGITTSRKGRYALRNVVAKKGAKSFRTTQEAQDWAKEQGLDTKKYELYAVRPDKIQWRQPLRE